MGGDGGTLNNSRADHVRMRRDMLDCSSKETCGKQLARERASVTMCAASQQQLRQPVVVDRLGQLFNKDALIACLLARSSAFSHIRSMSRDTADVNFNADKYARLHCAVTRETVTERGNFGVFWKCGCVVSAAAAEMVSGKPRQKARGNDETLRQTCPACGQTGAFVRLGLTGDERQNLLADILQHRRARKNSLHGKREKRDSAQSADPKRHKASGDEKPPFELSNDVISERSEKTAIEMEGDRCERNILNCSQNDACRSLQTDSTEN